MYQSTLPDLTQVSRIFDSPHDTIDVEAHSVNFDFASCTTTDTITWLSMGRFCKQHWCKLINKERLFIS